MIPGIAVALIAPVSLVLPAPRAHASAGTVLILDSSVSGGSSSQEALAAQALGYSVNVVAGTTWDSMTTAQFASYSAIILGDPTCSGSDSASVGAAETNASTWGAAINGNVAIVGTDPVFHNMNGNNQAGALKVTDDAVAYALAHPGTTGAYISLSCYYASSSTATAPAVLSGIAGGGFSVHGGVTCADSGHVESDTASATVSWSNLTDSDLYFWSCSVHEAFLSWPSTFVPLAIDPSASPPDYTGSDGIAGQPYILVLNESAATGLSAPQNLSVIPRNGSAFVSWQAPATDHGGPIEDYVVTATPVYTDRLPAPGVRVISTTVAASTFSTIITGVCLRTVMSDTSSRFRLRTHPASDLPQGRIPSDLQASWSTSHRPSLVLHCRHT